MECCTVVLSVLAGVRGLCANFTLIALIFDFLGLYDIRFCRCNLLSNMVSVSIVFLLGIKMGSTFFGYNPIPNSVHVKMG
jgi:hypothetical protein